MGKKHQYEKDTLKDFMAHLRDNDFTVVKNITPKYYERTNYKGDSERTMIKFHLDLKKVSKKDIEREVNLFILENFDV